MRWNACLSIISPTLSLAIPDQGHRGRLAALQPAQIVPDILRGLIKEPCTRRDTRVLNSNVGRAGKTERGMTNGS